MTGQSVSGLLTIGVLVLCKAAISAEHVDEVGSYAFFFSNAALVFISGVLYFIIRQSEFTKYNLSMALAGQRATQDVEDAASINPDQESEALRASASATESSRLLDYSSIEIKRIMASTSILSVIKRIWIFPLITFCSFFITASQWPGLVLMIKPANGNNMSGWFSIIVVACFCVGDFGGRFLTAPIAKHMGKISLTLLAFLRLGFYPLIILQNSPRLIQSDAVLFVVAALLPFTSGFVGGSAMMLAPQAVKSHERETTGTIMTFALNGGIVAGTGGSILLLYILTGSVWSSGG